MIRESTLTTSGFQSLQPTLLRSVTVVIMFLQCLFTNSKVRHLCHDSLFKLHCSLLHRLLCRIPNSSEPRSKGLEASSYKYNVQPYNARTYYRRTAVHYHFRLIMTVRHIPSQLSDLPTFAYTKAAKNTVARHSGRAKNPTGGRTKHKAVSIYQGNKDYTRCVLGNMIDLARWEGEEIPGEYPVNLRHPEDMLKAVLYTGRIAQRHIKAGKKPKESTRTQSPGYRLWDKLSRCRNCPNKPTTISGMCSCTTTPWDDRNTFAWQKANIELRVEDEALGVGTYALSSFKVHEVLGEYVGELVPADDTDSRYLFGIDNHEKRTVANIDSLRLGNWTRFINHSCDPNARFQVVRVGDGARVICKALRTIREEDEITVDYGEGYWTPSNKKGVWCRCGEADCKYAEKDGSGTTSVSKKGKKKAR